jgi:hypothetical protein
MNWLPDVEQRSFSNLFAYQWNPKLMFSIQGLPHLVFSFRNPKSVSPSVEFPPFKIFLSLVSKSIGPQRNLRERKSSDYGPLECDTVWFGRG